MHMAYKSLLNLTLAMTLALTLAGCSADTNITTKEFKELKDYTSIGGNEIADVKEGLRKFIIKAYTPTSQSDLDSSYDLISKYSTDSLIDAMKKSANTYKEGAKQEVEINTVTYGECTPRESILCDFTVKFNGTHPDLRVFVEFYINTDGKLYDYDIWQYEL